MLGWFMELSLDGIVFLQVYHPHSPLLPVEKQVNIFYFRQWYIEGWGEGISFYDRVILVLPTLQTVET